MINIENKDFKFGNNAFDILRYWAAISVMLGHYAWKTQSFSESGQIAMTVISEISGFFPGVVVLFALSGYLVSASYERSKNRKEFFVKRILRMYPELWVCTLVNLIVIIVLAYKLLDKSILIWILTQVFGIANTPSCLKDFATGSVNGALWTIFTELQLYIVLGLIYTRLKKLNIFKWLLLLVFLTICNVLTDIIISNYDGTIGELIERFFLPYALWFFIGVFCYIRKEQVIPILKKFTLPLIIIYIILQIILINIPGHYANIAIGILLPLIVIGGAYCLPKIRVFCDLSYEIFLYHWIVLNVIIHFNLMNKLPWGVCLFIFILITLVLSWLSWRYAGKGRGLYK